MSTRAGREATNSIRASLEDADTFEGLFSFTTERKARKALKRFQSYWEAHIGKPMPELVVCWDNTLQSYMARTPDKRCLVGQSDVFAEVCDGVIKICLWKPRLNS